MEPGDFAYHNARMRQYLDRYGYTDAEIICDEWNYVENFGERWTASIEHMTGMHGAAFAEAVMLSGQNDPNCDMLMYYDVRPCGMNGVYDFYTLRPIKGYYSLWAFSELYKLGNQVECSSCQDGIYACAAADGERCAVVITHYNKDFNTWQKKIQLNLGKPLDGFRMYVTDRDYTMTPTQIPENGELSLSPDTVILLVNYML